MIKFRASDNNGKPLIGIGFSKGNIEKLVAGQPVMIKGGDLGLPQLGEIFIFYGETEKKMYEDLKKAGFDLGQQFIDLKAMREK